MKITATTVYFLKKPPVLLDLVQKGTLTTISKPNTSTSTNMIKDSSSSTKDDLWSMWSSQVNTTLCRGKEQAWLSEGIGPAAKRMANNTKTYHYCHSYISTKHCIKKTVFWLIQSSIQSIRLPVEERNRHEIGLWGCFTSKGANTTKTYYWCHSSIINKSFSIKTVFWLVVSPFYQWGIEAGL